MICRHRSVTILPCTDASAIRTCKSKNLLRTPEARGRSKPHHSHMFSPNRAQLSNRKSKVHSKETLNKDQSASPLDQQANAAFSSFNHPEQKLKLIILSLQTTGSSRYNLRKITFLSLLQITKKIHPEGSKIKKIVTKLIYSKR